MLDATGVPREAPNEGGQELQGKALEYRDFEGAECLTCGQSCEFDGEAAEGLAEFWCREHVKFCARAYIDRWSGWEPKKVLDSN